MIQVKVSDAMERSKRRKKSVTQRKAEITSVIQHGSVPNYMRDEASRRAKELTG